MPGVLGIGLREENGKLFDELAIRIYVDDFSQISVGIGTRGTVVQDSETGEPLGLSCYHVVGDKNTIFSDSIWQPKEPCLVSGSTIPPHDNIGYILRVNYPLILSP